METQPMTPPPATPQAPKRAGIAIASLVLGILAYVCFGPLTGIPAIIWGQKARKQIALSGGTLDGAGTGWKGLIMMR